MTDRDETDVSYADAVHELETIISALEGDQLDIDGLAERVARAANLIEVCRSRIELARVEVNKVVSGLESQG